VFLAPDCLFEFTVQIWLRLLRIVGAKSVDPAVTTAFDPSVLSGQRNDFSSLEIGPC
jgi:hypothetical protein